MPIRPVSAWMDRAGFQSRCSAVKPRREHVVVSLQRLSRDDPSPTIQHNVLHNVALQVNNVALTVLNRDWSRKDVLRSDWLDIEIFTRFAPILTLLLGGSGGGVKPEAAARAGQQAVCSTPGLLHSSSHGFLFIKLVICLDQWITVHSTFRSHFESERRIASAAIRRLRRPDRYCRIPCVRDGLARVRAPRAAIIQKPFHHVNSPDFSSPLHR